MVYRIFLLDVVRINLNYMDLFYKNLGLAQPGVYWVSLLVLQERAWGAIM